MARVSLAAFACARRVVMTMLRWSSVHFAPKCVQEASDVRGEWSRRKWRSSVHRGGNLQLVGLRRVVRNQVAHNGAQSVAPRSAATTLLWQPRPAGVLNGLGVEPGRASYKSKGVIGREVAGCRQPVNASLAGMHPTPVVMIRNLHDTVYLVRGMCRRYGRTILFSAPGCWHRGTRLII